MDREVIEQKLESLRRSKSEQSRARVNRGAYLIAEMDVPSPDTMGQTFDVLAHAGAIPQDLAQQLKKAVGLRNIAVHLSSRSLPPD